MNLILHLTGPTSIMEILGTEDTVYSLMGAWNQNES